MCDPRVGQQTDLGPRPVEERAVDAVGVEIGEASSVALLGDEHRGAAGGAQHRDQRRRRGPAVGRAVDCERFVLDASLHGAVGRFDLVRSQPHGPDDARRDSRRCDRREYAASRTMDRTRSRRRSTRSIRNRRRPGGSCAGRARSQRSASISSAVSGARFGAPKTTSASEPTTTPMAMASTTSSAPVADESTRSSARTAIAPHSARFQRRLIHTLASVTTAALDARYAELGNPLPLNQPSVTPFTLMAWVRSGRSSTWSASCIASVGDDRAEDQALRGGATAAAR